MKKKKKIFYCGCGKLFYSGRSIPLKECMYCCDHKKEFHNCYDFLEHRECNLIPVSEVATNHRIKP